jgi:hypothetical protein
MAAKCSDEIEICCNGETVCRVVGRKNTATVMDEEG